MPYIILKLLMNEKSFLFAFSFNKKTLKVVIVFL